MKAHRWVTLEGKFAPNAHDEALEIDVTWEEFEQLLHGAQAGGLIVMSVVLEHCRRIFDVETIALIESYVLERGDLPMFAPSKSAAGARPALRLVEGALR